jgi:uncharacterized protein YdeI (YjbR/CyaY-like superfamily)
MKPLFFSNQSQLRKWFEKNYDKKSELFVGYYKVSSGKPSVNWSQSVDEALCFGWIDGIRKSIDEESYMIRFTPRNPNSNWSAINIKKVEELTKLGLMKPRGIAAFEKRKEKNSEIYSYEKQNVKLSPEFLKHLKANKKAWAYFNSQPPYYQRVTQRWVMSAKQEATRIKRLHILIRDCAAGVKIKQMQVGSKK